jgi:hypothetical protein
MNYSESPLVSSQSALVHTVAVWVQDRDQPSLRLQSLAQTQERKSDLRRDVRLEQGEEIATRAASQKRVVIQEHTTRDERSEVESATAAEIAIPVMRGQHARAVVVLSVSSGPAAFEIWSRDDRDELAVSLSYYAGVDSFEFISQYVRFPKGAGLPGIVWKTGDPRIAADLPSNARFMRSFASDEAELKTGAAIPIGSAGGNPESVLVLLSSAAIPIANAFEIWTPADGHAVDPESAPRLVRTQTDRVSEDLRSAAGKQESDCESAIINCWLNELPVLAIGRDFPESSQPNGAPHSCGPSALLAIPVFRGIQRTAVIVMRFLSMSVI